MSLIKEIVEKWAGEEGDILKLPELINKLEKAFYSDQPKRDTTPLEELAIIYIVARAEFYALRDNPVTPEQWLFKAEMDMFETLVNLNNYVRFQTREWFEALGGASKQ